MPHASSSGRLLFACALLSIAAAVLGFHRLLRYEGRAGAAGATPALRPALAELDSTPDRTELVVFAHPMCPCTRATLDNLEWLVARIPRHVRTLVVLGAQGFDRAAIERSGLWRRAGELSLVERIADPDGAIARRFGVRTSGDARLYAAGGALLYAGGITDARGHAGRFPGLDALEHLASHPKLALEQRLDTPVYGCAIEDS